jgi:hypothetical protein
LLLMDSTEGEAAWWWPRLQQLLWDYRLTRHFSSGVNSVRANGTLQPKRQQWLECWHRISALRSAL